MEWSLDGGQAETLTAFRHEVAAYLRRHAGPESDLAGAEIVAAELVSSVLSTLRGTEASAA